MYSQSTEEKAAHHRDLLHHRHLKLKDLRDMSAGINRSWKHVSYPWDRKQKTSQIKSRVNDGVDDRWQEPKGALLTNLCQRAPVGRNVRSAAEEQADGEADHEAPDENDHDHADDLEAPEDREDAAAEV